MSIEGDTVCIPQYLSWYYRDFADSVAEAVKTVADKYLRNPLRDVCRTHAHAHDSIITNPALTHMNRVCQQILSTLLNGGRLRVTDFCWDFSLQFLTQMDDGAIVYNNIVFSEPGSGGGSNSEGSTAMIHVSAKPRFKWRAQRPFTGSLPSARAHHSTAHNEQWIYLYGGRLTDTNAVTGSLYALQLGTPRPIPSTRESERERETRDDSLGSQTLSSGWRWNPRGLAGTATRVSSTMARCWCLVAARPTTSCATR